LIVNRFKAINVTHCQILKEQSELAEIRAPSLLLSKQRSRTASS